MINVVMVQLYFSLSDPNLSNFLGNQQRIIGPRRKTLPLCPLSFVADEGGSHVTLIPQPSFFPFDKEQPDISCIIFPFVLGRLDLP